MMYWWRVFLRSLGMDKWFRKNHLNPRDDLYCSWCHRLTHTTEGEVWNHQQPVGTMIRLCKECEESCA